MIGLPAISSEDHEDVKKPNLSEYRVFVQDLNVGSRFLPEGSSILIDGKVHNYWLYHAWLASPSLTVCVSTMLLLKT